MRKGIAFSLGLQAGVALVLAAASLLGGTVAAYSSLAGSVAVFFPGLLFTLLVTGKIGEDSGAFLKTAVVAEFAKLGLTAVLCAVIFIAVKPLAPGFFFIGLIGIVVAGRIGMTRVFRE
ncbi:MAG: ATP synthase subunit I [Lysobacterales bacterium]